MTIKYIEVKFSDNDFGYYITQALKSLWEYVTEDITAHAGYEHLTIEEVYENLHKVGAIEEIVRQLTIAEYLKGRVAQGLLSLYFSKRDNDWQRRIPKNTMKENCERFHSYFNFKIELHNDLKFSEKWRNSEHHALDINTGYVWSF